MRNFCLTRHFWFFGPNLHKKTVPGRKLKKREQRHWILHIRISLGTKFQLKLTISIFWTNFAQKGCFQSKTENVNTTIAFCVFELVYVPNFSLNWQFWFFGPSLPKKGISSSKWKKWISPLNSAYSDWTRCRISA